MTAHTRGPWVWGWQNGLLRVRARGSTNPVCGVHRIGRMTGREVAGEAVGNARLISASPDMLAALKRIVADAGSRTWFHALEAARDAIAKAEQYEGEGEECRR